VSWPQRPEARVSAGGWEQGRSVQISSRCPVGGGRVKGKPIAKRAWLDIRLLTLCSEQPKGWKFGERLKEQQMAEYGYPLADIHRRRGTRPRAIVLCGQRPRGSPRFVLFAIHSGYRCEAAFILLRTSPAVGPV